MKNKKLLMRIMVILFLLTTVNFYQSLANEQSLKEVKISLSVDNMSIENILKEIEKLSGFSFFYVSENLDLTDFKSLDLSNASVEKVLVEIFKGTNINFRQAENQIILKEKRKVTKKKLDKASLEFNKKRFLENLQNKEFVFFKASQKKQITGRVTSAEDNQGLPGVNIVEKGTSNGAVTNLEGRYTLSVDEEATLVFSSVGYVTREIETGDRSTIDIVMKPDVQQLQELVVVGYGVQKRADLTSAIATVDAKEIKNNPVASWSSALQGISPGVEVQSNQGRPGSGGTIRIRGVGSINDTDPLIVVDGVPMGSGAVMPSDIESIEILKDAASAAIYGSRGANGVILITTKKGKKGEPQISLNSYYGVENAWKQLDLMNSQQWADLVTEVNENADRTPPTMATWIKTGDSNYDGTDSDWQDAMFQTGAIQEHALSVSGGTDAGNYYISGGYYNQEGIMRATAYQRFNIRVNSSWTYGKFKFGENIGYRYYDKEDEDSGGGRSLIEAMLKETGPVKIYDKNRLGGFGGPTSQDGHDANNPVGLAERKTNDTYGRLFSANVWGQFEILNGLNYKMNVGYQNDDVNDINWQLATDLGPKSIDRTSLKEKNTWRYRWVWENTLNYHKTFGDHGIDVLAGIEYQKIQGRSLSGNAENFLSADPDFYILPKNGQENIRIGGGASDQAYVGYIGRLSYDYQNKYLLTGTIRRDGTSRFSPVDNRRWGTFPSISAAWRISEEPFFANIPVISELKIRGSWGQLGNDNTTAFPHVFRVSPTPDYGLNGENTVQAPAPVNFVNREVVWETVETADVGIDLGMFEDKLTLLATYYNKQTKDFLISLPIPQVTGFGNTSSQYPPERGRKYNTLFIPHNTFFENLFVDVSSNLTTVHNELVELSPGVNEFLATEEYRTGVGFPIGYMYGYKTDGIYQNESEVADALPDASSPDGPRPGDVRFVDTNGPAGEDAPEGQQFSGEPDGEITFHDRAYLGKTIPDFYYGLNFNFNWKNFDATIFFQGVSGVQLYNAFRQRAFNAMLNGGGRNGITDVLNRWTGEGTSNTMPRAVFNDPNKNTRASDRYIEDGSYLRIKNVTLGYTLPESLTGKINLSRARIYASAQNLFTFTDYQGFDPEVGFNGIDHNVYPINRTISVGINLGF